jgi:hypothetical protein
LKSSIVIGSILLLFISRLQAQVEPVRQYLTVDLLFAYYHAKGDFPSREMTVWANPKISVLRNISMQLNQEARNAGPLSYDRMPSKRGKFRLRACSYFSFIRYKSLILSFEYNPAYSNYGNWKIVCRSGKQKRG